MAVEVAPGLHHVSIYPISEHEFNVSCENKNCDYNHTTFTRAEAKDKAYAHLRDLIASES
jgi:hypothetical protein